MIVKVKLDADIIIDLEKYSNEKIIEITKIPEEIEQLIKVRYPECKTVTLKTNRLDIGKSA